MTVRSLAIRSSTSRNTGRWPPSLSASSRSSAWSPPLSDGLNLRAPQSRCEMRVFTSAGRKKRCSALGPSTGLCLPPPRRSHTSLFLHAGGLAHGLGLRGRVLVFGSQSLESHGGERCRLHTEHGVIKTHHRRVVPLALVFGRR